MKRICSTAIAPIVAFAALAGLAHSPHAMAADKEATSTATDADKSYLALRNSKDPKTQLMAERWYGLVKLREWADASGQFKTNAKYVEQDEKQGTVKLRVIKGAGRDQVVKDKTIPIDKLSKECQARVKQIAFLAEKVDEAAKAEAEKAAKPKEGQDSMAGMARPTPDESGGRGERMNGMIGDQPPAGERGSRPSRGNSDRTAADDRARRATGPDEQPKTESPPGEPAAALPAAMAPLPIADAATMPPPASPANTNAVASDPRGGPRPVQPPNLPDDQPWRNSFDAFRANITATRTDSGWQLSWGELTALKLAHDQTVAPYSSAASREGPLSTMSLESLGEFVWEAPLTQQPDDQIDWSKTLNLTLPEPFRLICELDNERGPGEWRRFFPGDQVKFIGHFIGFEGEGGIRIAIRFPDDVPVPVPVRSTGPR